MAKLPKEIIVKVAIQGLCRTCKWWENRPMDFVFEWCKKLGVQTGADFGCIHWEGKE